jgi:putative ATPase
MEGSKRKAGFETLGRQELAGGVILELVQGDITRMEVDAIVNAANERLAHGGGVAGAIVRRGGQIIQRQSDEWVRQHGLASPERPAITGAGALPCRYVIHAVGPRWGQGGEEAKLETAVRGALALADAQGCRSVALPAISTGIFGFPKDLAAQVILGAIEAFAGSGPSSLREVYLVLYDQPTLQAFAQAFRARWSQGDGGR